MRATPTKGTASIICRSAEPSATYRKISPSATFVKLTASAATHTAALALAFPPSIQNFPTRTASATPAAPAIAGEPLATSSAAGRAITGASASLVEDVVTNAQLLGAEKGKLPRVELISDIKAALPITSLKGFGKATFLVNLEIRSTAAPASDAVFHSSEEETAPRAAAAFPARALTISFYLSCPGIADINSEARSRPRKAKAGKKAVPEKLGVGNLPSRPKGLPQVTGELLEGVTGRRLAS